MPHLSKNATTQIVIPRSLVGCSVPPDWGAGREDSTLVLRPLSTNVSRETFSVRVGAATWLFAVSSRRLGPTEPDLDCPVWL